MRIAEPFKVTIEERPLPKLEHPDDALIKVTTAAICGPGIVYSSIYLFNRLLIVLFRSAHVPRTNSRTKQSLLR
jgi:hypothetical protein